MILLRKSGDRGTTKLDWLESRHTFSFGDYYNPKWEGFRSLRVINEDIVEPGNGFPSHFHKDMEIITYIIEGSIQHKDNTGGGSIIHPGEVQKMSAGQGQVSFIVSLIHPLVKPFIFYKFGSFQTRED